MIAYNEYEELKKKYVIWYQKQKKNNYSLTREEFGKIMKDIPVPDIIIKLPLDENEQVPTDNEW